MPTAESDDDTPETKTEVLKPEPVTPEPSQRKTYPLRNRQPLPKDEDSKGDIDSVNHIDFCYLMNAPLTYDEAQPRFAKMGERCG